MDIASEGFGWPIRPDHERTNLSDHQTCGLGTEHQEAFMSRSPNTWNLISCEEHKSQEAIKGVWLWKNSWDSSQSQSETSLRFLEFLSAVWCRLADVNTALPISSLLKVSPPVPLERGRTRHLRALCSGKPYQWSVGTTKTKPELQSPDRGEIFCAKCALPKKKKKKKTRSSLSFCLACSRL